MPGLDRSGPRGDGPMTGGRRGVCGRPGVVDIPQGYGGIGNGRGMGFGRGPGWGIGARRGRRPAAGRWGWRDAAGSPPDNQMATEGELAILKADVDAIKASLEAIQGRLENLGQGEVSD